MVGKSRVLPMVLCLAAAMAACTPANARDLKLLFLGDRGHHQPMLRYRQLQPVMAAKGINVAYTENAAELNPQSLGRYDGLIVYANTTQITPAQEKALLDYVAGGKGFIPLHCASFCFLNSPEYISLVGAQFKRHDVGVFRTVKAEVDHPILKGYSGFESWDETYEHAKHNEKDRTVLEYRVQGEHREPWTWVRTHGDGRVFYTAWGHDERTWSNPGFQNLIERGVRWACKDEPSLAGVFVDRPEMTPIAKDLKPFEMIDGTLPFYPPSTRWGVIGEPIKKVQKPLPVEESVKHVSTPVGFEVKLFASEKDLHGKPICMNWDERGRLWVALTIDYPNQKRYDGTGRDKIVICEDTDGDGVADKFTTFADKLSIPTSMVFANGGLVVHQAPETLFLKDTNGDDVADIRKVLFTGWHTDDTHAGPSNLIYGLDNWLYGMVGYAGFNGTIGGEQQSFRTGLYRFKPDGSKFEFLRNTNNNSWGVGMSEEGILFGSTANGCPSVYMPIANRYYESVRGWSSTVLAMISESNKIYPIRKNVRQVDYHGGFTAGAGHALYTARTYPKEYWNRTAFVCEPTGSLTATFQLFPNGADYRSKNSWNLFVSDDEWSAPVVADIGPDGNVWISDWYNIVVQHNPTPQGFETGKGAAYETPLRDKKYARIYRVVYKSASPAAPVNLKDASPEILVATLKNPNMFWRRHAQRLLVERGKTDVVPALVALANDASVDEVGLNPGAMHALWTLHALGAIPENAEATAAATAALKHKSAGVRRNAALVLPRTPATFTAIRNAGLFKDVNGQVKLAALLTTAEIAAPEAAPVVFQSLVENEGDRWLTDAATSAAAKNSTAFLKQISAADVAPNPAVAKTAGIVAEHVGRGGSAEVAELLVTLSGSKSPYVGTIVAGLSKGWPRDKSLALTPEQDEAVAKLFTTLPAEDRGPFIALANRLGSKKLEQYAGEIAKSLLATASNADVSDNRRIQAAQQLVDFRRNDPAVASSLLEQITPRTSPGLAAGLMEAMGRSEASAVGEAIVKRIPSLTPGAKDAAFRVLLSRAEWSQALLDGAEKGKLVLSDLALDQKMSLANHPNKTLSARASKLLAAGGGLPNADRVKVVEQFQYLASKTGNAVAGKAIFKKQCANCHMHGGEGANIGPDLTGMSVHPKSELLVHILDPSRSVEGNFRAYSVSLSDGRVMTGLLSSETRTSIELVDSQAKRHQLQREDVEQIVASPKSLMPEGFEKQVSADDLSNLLEFLTQRGKYVPLDLGKVASVVTTRGMFFQPTGREERLVFQDWKPKTFNGVPFLLVDPKGDRQPNAVMLYGPHGNNAPKMPKSVKLVCNAPTRAVHLLSGISGWGFPASEAGSVSMIVRFHYADGKTEDHELKNGEHFSDYIRRVDVPGSKFAFRLRSQQLRYLAVSADRAEPVKEIEFVKGPDDSAPIVMAATVETR